jgi:type IV secretion system protein VirB11
MLATIIETQASRRQTALRVSAGELLGLGAEKSVEDVVINPDGSLWVNRTGEGFRCLGQRPEAWVRAVLLQIAYEQGFEFNSQHPILETDIPDNGARITGLCPPIVRGVSLAIRPHPKVKYTLDDYTRAGIISRKDDPLNSRTHRVSFLDQVRGKDHGEILALAVQYRQNILMGGSTGSGKTTCLNMLFSEIGRLCPDDRIVGIEDTLELQWQGIRNHVSLLASNGITTQRCLETALRLKPHRIVVGEVRKRAAARALLDAWNTGHRGGMATVHADDARSTLQRFEELLRDSDRPAIARALNVVVFIDECDQLAAGRKLKEILIVHGYEKGDYKLESV